MSDPQFDARSNVLGTINVLEASRRAGVQRVVYAASGGTRYGAPTHLPVDETAQLEPLAVWGGQSRSEVLYAPTRGCMDRADLSGVGQRLWTASESPWGAGVIAIFGSRMISGRPVTVYGDGTATRNFVYVDDVVDAFVRAGQAPLTTVGTYNIGTGQQTTVSKCTVLFLRSSIGRRYTLRRGKDWRVACNCVGCDESRKGTRVETRCRSFEGMQRTMQWLRATLSPEPTALVNHDDKMSVVGPRPPSRREVEAYGDDVPAKAASLSPGITGLGRQ